MSAGDRIVAASNQPHDPGSSAAEDGERHSSRHQRYRVLLDICAQERRRRRVSSIGRGPELEDLGMYRLGQRLPRRYDAVAADVSPTRGCGHVRREHLVGTVQLAGATAAAVRGAVGGVEGKGGDCRCAGARNVGWRQCDDGECRRSAADRTPSCQCRDRRRSFAREPKRSPPGTAPLPPSP